MRAEKSTQFLDTEKTECKQHFSIVVAGEFNSGKSSVINLLLRKEVLPTSVGPSNLPPAKIASAENEIYDIRAIHSSRQFGKSEFFAEAQSEAISEINIETPLDGFDGTVISEVSVGQDGNLTPEGQAVLAEADLLIWCTMGQRAWCLSEITIVEQLPKSLLDTAILAVSRTDYLRNSEDLGKVKDRLSREASEFFKSTLMLDCSGKSISTAHNSEEWELSGGKALFVQVSEELNKSPFKGRIRLASNNKGISAPVAARPKVITSRAEIFTAWKRELDSIENWVLEQDSIDGRQFARQVHKRMIEISATSASPNKFRKLESGRVLAFKKAADHLDRALADPGASDVALLAAELALQLSREMCPTSNDDRPSKSQRAI